MFINYNGKIIDEQIACISADNRSFRYGDGCFETIRMMNHSMALMNLHLNRLFFSLQQLQFDVPAHFTPSFITKCMVETAKKNKLENCRIRLTIFRGNGGLYDPENHLPNFIIHTYPLNNATPLLNENGLLIDIFRNSIKSADQYSAIKSNQF